MTRSLDRAARVAAIGITGAVEAAGLAAELRRPAVLYLLVTGCNLPGATVASIAGCTKQNVSKHLARLEAAREDPRIDAALERIEQKLFGGW